MNAITIAGVVDDPGFKGLPAPDIHLGNGAEIAIAGIRDGTNEGRPTLALSFALPDGRTVLVETSWRLWMTATEYFAAKFGDAETVGMKIEYSPTGDGRMTSLEIVAEGEQQFVECELCGATRKLEDFDAETDKERGIAMLQWLRRHFLEKHPGWTAPA